MSELRRNKETFERAKKEVLEYDRMKKKPKTGNLSSTVRTNSGVRFGYKRDTDK